MRLLFSHPFYSWIYMSSLASWSHQKIVSRYWACSKALFKVTVSSHVVQSSAAEQRSGGGHSHPNQLGGPCTLGPQLWLQWIVTKHSIFGIALILYKLHEIWKLVLRKIIKNCCHQMSYFKAEMYQIRLHLGLGPRPRWGSLQRFPRSSSWI